MERSKKFQTVKDYYDRNLWTEAMVRNAVGRWITEGEAEEIVGRAAVENGDSKHQDTMQEE